MSQTSWPKEGFFTIPCVRIQTKISVVQVPPEALTCRWPFFPCVFVWFFCAYVLISSPKDTHYMSLNLTIKLYMLLGMVAHDQNPSTWDSEARGSKGLGHLGL